MLQLVEHHQLDGRKLRKVPISAVRFNDVRPVNTGLSATNRPLRPRAFASKSTQIDRSGGAGSRRSTVSPDSPLWTSPREGPGARRGRRPAGGPEGPAGPSMNGRIWVFTKVPARLLPAGRPGGAGDGGGRRLARALRAQPERLGAGGVRWPRGGACLEAASAREAFRSAAPQARLRADPDRQRARDGTSRPPATRPTSTACSPSSTGSSRAATRVDRRPGTGERKGRRRHRGREHAGDGRRPTTPPAIPERYLKERLAEPPGRATIRSVRVASRGRGRRSSASHRV